MNKEDFDRLLPKWSSKLPSLPEDLNPVLDRLDPTVQNLARNSWLAGRVHADGMFGVGCIICNLALCCGGATAQAFHLGDARAFATFRVKRWNFSNFARHQQKPCHQAALRKVFGAEGWEQAHDKAPSSEAFRTVWRAIRQGHAPSAGIEGIGLKQKVARMCWCLAESLRDRDRELVAIAESIGIARDESKNRLDCRFSITFVQDGLVTNRKGFLGRAHSVHGSRGVDILRDTDRIFKDFATPRAGSVYPSKWTTPGKLDSQLYEHMRASLRHLSVDSASAELLAGRLMQLGERLDESRAFAPNLVDVTRDKTHAARRTPRVASYTRVW